MIKFKVKSLDSAINDTITAFKGMPSYQNIKDYIVFPKNVTFYSISFEETSGDMVEIEELYNGFYSITRNGVDEGDMFYLSDVNDAIEDLGCQLQNLHNPVDLFSVQSSRYDTLNVMYNDSFLLTTLEYIVSPEDEIDGHTYVEVHEFLNKLIEKIKIERSNEMRKLLAFSTALRAAIYSFFNIKENT